MIASGGLGIALCIGLFVVSILMIVAGMMLMKKAKEVKDKKRDEKDNWGSLQGNVNNQATMNQRGAYPASTPPPQMIQ